MMAYLCYAEMFAPLILPPPPPFDSQLRSFGAKLKEQNNLFRKRSKAQSHDMKEVLYSNIVQANEVGDSAPRDTLSTWRRLVLES